MRALSIRQPWAWLILNAGKDIENRVWSTRVRGRVLVHAGKGMTRMEYTDAVEFAHEECGVPILKLPTQNELYRGGIVGSVEIVDCVDDSDSPWFVGEFGFMLQHPCRFAEPLEWKGEPGFFHVPDDVAKALS